MRVVPPGQVARACLIGSLLLGACGGGQAPPKESPTPPVCTATPVTECPTPAPTYADVTPILHARCVTCHSGSPGGPWPLAGYQDVADWADTIRGDLLDCTMPPSNSGVFLSDAERTEILTWIRCGFPE